MTAVEDRAVIVTDPSAPDLAVLLQDSLVSAITGDTAPPEVANRLEMLRQRMSGLPPAHRGLLTRFVSDILKGAGWPSPTKYAEQALGTGGATLARGTMAAPDEPWPKPVDGAQLLNGIVATVRRYVAMPREAAHAAALWVLHTYVPDAADFTPYLLITSPVRECGKTTLLDTLEPLVYRPRHSDGMTAAALYRTIDRDAPTILLDELDTRLAGEGGESLRGVLNSGFKPSGRTTICVGEQHDAKDFKTYCPKVLAGIGRPWDTVLSRSIPVPMARATPAERRRLRKLAGATIRDQLAPLRRQALRWAADARSALTEHRFPDVPEALSARQSDIWRPLLAIAEASGGRWPARARSAALRLHGRAEEEGDFGLLALADVRSAFVASGADKLRMSALLDSLLAHEDRPWPEMPGGRPLTLPALSKLLRRFGLHSVAVRDAQGVAKGYRWEDLAAVFARYLPALEAPAPVPPAIPVTSVTTPPPQREGEGSQPVTDVTVTEGDTGAGPERCPRCGSDELTWLSEEWRCGACALAFDPPPPADLFTAPSGNGTGSAPDVSSEERCLNCGGDNLTWLDGRNQCEDCTRRAAGTAA